jgi:hypothetical protein
MIKKQPLKNVKSEAKEIVRKITVSGEVAEALERIKVAGGFKSLNDVGRELLLAGFAANNTISFATEFNVSPNVAFEENETNRKENLLNFTKYLETEYLEEVSKSKISEVAEEAEEEIEEDAEFFEEEITEEQEDMFNSDDTE